tara:strand:- start:93 stop:1190 length:1098 start_codon:yes stop_codon:yes gene_type:complete
MKLNNLKINENNGFEIGQNVSIDGPINNNHSLHILSHAHTDHAKEGEIAESLSNTGTEILMTEPTKDLLEYTNLNLRTSSRFQTLKYNKKEVFEEAGGVEVTFIDANHMLGSTQVQIEDPNLDFSVGYSGDIGRNIEQHIDVDVLFLDSTYVSFEDRHRYTKEDAFDAFAIKAAMFLNKGIGINIVANSGLLQSTVHNLGIRSELMGFDIWEKFPTIICGGQSKGHAGKIKHFCNVYKNNMYEIPDVLNIKDDKDDTWPYEIDNSRIAIFSSVEDIQNNHLPTFICKYNPSSLSEPIIESNTFENGFHVALSEHDTGNSIEKYIKKVDPQLVITDASRTTPERAEDLAILIKNKLEIEAITSRKL